MAIEYIGEHLAAGRTGNMFVLISFVASIVAAVSYFFSVKSNLADDSWKRIARISFRIHSLSVAGIIATLFWMLFNHYFEYEYVWHHSNTEMPMKYIMSCFWEGQEGSFLLWMFWQCVLGNILMRTAKDWESPVMTTVSIAQVFLSSMLLGVYVMDYKFGSNPFTVLLRETPDFGKIPLFQNADYLTKLDGRGLNPLLQNYWMTIHPPTLFLGFASTLVPFAYAIAGLWTKRFNEWQKPAIPWTFFGVMILGTGILMGGAWAYEALSFGGFWAWDPVENASLVPWLTFVASAHVMLINKNKGGSLFVAFLLTTVTYILVLYSTFLTRSGILGDTSVHSFTDLGLLRQLLFYLLFFVALTVYLLILDKKTKNIYAVGCMLLFVFMFFVPGAAIPSSLFFTGFSLLMLSYGYVIFFPKEKDEEELWSREFWMFIGALVLLISAGQMILETSQPVLNKLFHMTKSARTNRIEYYNTWQIPFAFLVTLLIGVGQYFKYKNTDIKEFAKRISLPFVVSIVVTAFIAIGLSLSNAFYCMLLFSSVFAVSANFSYFRRVLKGNVKKAGASVAHIGFGMIMLGALISTSKKDIISINTSGKDLKTLGKDFSNNTNILLSKGDTLKMGNYYVTYKGKEKKGVNVYFEIEYFTKAANGAFNYEFTLKPLVQTNPRMGNVAEPDTRHFLHKDIYTHVTYAELETLEGTSKSKDYDQAKQFTLHAGDTIYSSNSIIVLEKLDTQVDKAKHSLNDSDLAVGAVFHAYDINKKEFIAEPIYLIHNNQIEPQEAVIEELGLKFMFWKVNPENGKIDISLSERKSNKADFIVMEAIIFPYINILWLGCIVMIIGTLLAMRERLKRT